MYIANYLPIVASALQQQYGEFAQPYAEKILQHVTGCSRQELYLSAMRLIDEAMQQRCNTIIERCCNGEPLEYVTGVAYFYDREFVVTPDVLIPRPDTETLIETVLHNEPVNAACFADVGTGSGVVACILTEKRVSWVAAAVDCSISALHVAMQNRRNERVFPVCGNMVSMFTGRPVFDFIVSNPPYIPNADIETLDASVRNFEPHTALDGGSDGLDYYRYLAAYAPQCLRRGGYLYCEIGADQGESVGSLFMNERWCKFTIHKDLSGHNRVFFVQKVAL